MPSSFYCAVKKRMLVPVLFFAAFAFTACQKAPTVSTVAPDFSNADYVSSPYKHINNGGITEDAVMPYNIDAITGATLTVEGPGIVTSIPLSIRELENRNDGLHRGLYRDSRGAFVYEGLDLFYLLNDMVDGDNGIILTGTAYRVDLKNSNRASIATFTLDEVKAAHEAGRPILLASGVGTADEKTIAPFVFDAANESEHSEGYLAELDNDDGCLRLVYDLDAYGANAGYTTFSNVAYVYVCEEKEPGFKHTTANDEAYASSKYTDYIVTFRGKGLGREMDFTVRALEDLVSHNADGSLLKGGVGYSDFYSLANTTYWYVNEYEGLDLYKLLLYLGMPTAETMGMADARTTLVQFVAADGVLSKESFSIDTLSYPDAFGFYNKNAADMGDGGYAPTNADLVKTGYPVLLAYGVNNYPYTVTKADPGYLSGLANSGGPLRVVFGKTQYNHANGSNQVQYLSSVLVGEDLLYNTHKYTDVPAQNALAASEVNVLVTGENNETLIDRCITAGEIEDLVYGADVAGNNKKAASVKDSYEVEAGGSFRSDVYEGVNLEYFLMNALGLPGTNGTITFTGANGEMTVSLDSLFKAGFNAELGRDGLAPVLAFAKNGAPMVASSDADGYVDSIALQPMIETEEAAYTVQNDGGPLAVLLPSTSAAKTDARSIFGLTSITVKLVPDAYAHISAPYSADATQSVRFYGDGLEKEAVYTVSDIESRQTQVRTLDYSVLDGGGNRSEKRYRGIALYDLFSEIGIKSNAGEVTVYAVDGTTAVYSLSLLKKQTFTNFIAPEKPPLFAMLAYGTGTVGTDVMTGLPLVKDEASAGYDEAAGNAGGPLMLVIPQESADAANAKLCLKAVAAVEVSANDIDTWSHRMSDIYGEFLDYEFTFTVKNDDSEWSHVFTVGQLETMEDLIVRDRYGVLEIGESEGLDIWKFIQRFAGSVPGADDPVAVTVYAADGYKNDLLSVFYKEGFTDGVADENGDRKKLILSYAFNGCPLVDSESHEGYTGLAGNTAGPLRIVAETNQGASVKYVAKLVVTVPGTGAIDEYINQAAIDALS